MTAAAVVTRLFIYPIKSCAPIELSRLALDDFGAAGDRRFMLVDAEGRFLTARQWPRLLTVKPSLLPEGLLVSAPAMPDLVIDCPREASPSPREVRIWADRVVAQELDAHVSDWFTACIGRPCRLVFMPDAVHRQIDRQWVDQHRKVSFADGFPLLLTSRSSLDELNCRMGAPLDGSRFRPNIEIDGWPPFAEDHWPQVQVGEVVLRLCKPCSRCVLTTIDPITLEKGREPLETLATFRKTDSGILFGQNALHLGRGVISVGDRVVPCS